MCRPSAQPRFHSCQPYIYIYIHVPGVPAIGFADVKRHEREVGSGKSKQAGGDRLRQRYKCCQLSVSDSSTHRKTQASIVVQSPCVCVCVCARARARVETIPIERCTVVTRMISALKMDGDENDVSFTITGTVARRCPQTNNLGRERRAEAGIRTDTVQAEL